MSSTASDLGVVAADWRIERLGDLFSRIANGTSAKQSREGTGYPVTRIETISSGVIDPARVGYVDVPLEDLERFRLLSGDLLFSHINSIKHIGKIALVKDSSPPLYHGMNLLLLRPRRDLIHPSFAYYLLTSPPAKSLFESRAKPAINQASINQKQLQSIALPLPPYPEQKKIAAVLSSVDKVIEATQAVIEQTQRMKQGLMEELLTRGIGHTEFQETEIGRIPASWRVATLGTVADVAYGLTVNSKRRTGAGRAPYLRVANVHRGRLDLREVKDIGLLPGDAGKYRLEPGDVLCVEGHANPAELGRCALWRGELPNCLHQNHLLRARPHAVRSHFLCAYLNAMPGRSYFGLHCKTSSGLNTLNSRVFGGCPVAVPPEREQQQIEAILGALDAQEEGAARHLQQLLTLKRGLMQDLLTGRRRVPLSAVEVAAAEAEAAEAARQVEVPAARAKGKRGRKKRAQV
ncbi:MAG: restriction endonuclease subunit S [Planctomycetota bacterium]